MDLENSVVAICDIDPSNNLAGTGSILAPNLVLTCAHIYQRPEDSEPKLQNALNSVLCFHGAKYRPIRAALSAAPDLCCLEAQPIEGAVPLQLARTASLGKTPLTVAGFNKDQAGPRLHLIRDLQTRLGEESAEGGWLQFVQVTGGAPRYFSGSPVCARAGNGQLMIGTMYLGGESAGNSRLIATDRIAGFLAAKGFAVEVTVFSPQWSESARSAGDATTLANTANINSSSHSPVTQTINYGSK